MNSRRHSGHRSDRKGSEKRDEKKDHHKKDGNSSSSSDKKDGDKKDSKKEKDILSFDKIKVSNDGVEWAKTLNKKTCRQHTSYVMQLLYHLCVPAARHIANNETSTQIFSAFSLC